MEPLAIIGVDLDNVCRNFQKSFHQAFVSRYPYLEQYIKSEAIYGVNERYPFDKLDINGWTLMQDVAPREVFGFAEPFDGVVAALTELKQHCESLGYKVIICSHQRPDNQKYSNLWIEHNKIPITEAVYVTDSKQKWNHADIMIDDSQHVLDSKPEGKIAVKVNWPYNASASCDHAIDHISQFLPIFQQQIHPLYI